MELTGLEKTFQDALEELGSYKLTLTGDPVEQGLSTLHTEMVKAREASERASSVLAQAIWVRDLLKRDVNALKGLVSMKKADLLATNEKVRAGKDAKMRESLAELLLAEDPDYQKYLEVQSSLDLASAAVSSIEVYWRSFRDYRDDLNFQLKVVAQRVIIGEVDTVSLGIDGSVESAVQTLKVSDELFDRQEGIGLGIGEIDL